MLRIRTACLYVCLVCLFFGIAESLARAQTNPAPILNSISPASTTAGGSGFVLTAAGSNFVSSSVVQWNGLSRPTTYFSSGSLQANIYASDIANAGTASVTVWTPAPGGGISNERVFTVNAPVPTLAGISPVSATAGGSGFVLTASGSSFVANSVVQWNGQSRTTTFVDGMHLQANILAGDIANAGTAYVTVFTPAPGGGTSSARTFTVLPASNPTPILNSVSPTSATAGGSGFVLTAAGSNFVSSSVVQWNGSSRATAYVDSATLRANILTSDIAGSGTASVTVFTPTPGGGTSNAVTFTVNGPVPALNSINPTSAIAGGSGFVLTASGSSFLSNSVVRWNGQSRATTYVNSATLQANILAGDIANEGTASVTVFTPAPGGGTSNAVTFTISPASNPAPILNSVSPTSATAGGSGFVLTAAGSNFVSSSVVQWNGLSRPTTYFSSGSLQANIYASDIANAGTASVTVWTPAPGGGISNERVFTVNAPVPTLAGISPTSAIAGGSGFVLAASGSNFVTNSVVQWNGSSRPTTYLGSGSLQANIYASDIANAGTASVTVFTPAPGGGTSSAVIFTITPSSNPVPTLNSISPTSRTAGGSGFVLTASGSFFVGSSVVQWNGSSRATTYVDSGTLRADILASDIAGSGTMGVTVFTPTPGGGTSSAVPLTVNGPVPALWSISPTSMIAGGSGFVLAASGSNFVTNSVVQWNGQSRTTTYADGMHLQANILAGDIANAGTANVTVFTPAPGGGTSSSIGFVIVPPCTYAIDPMSRSHGPGLETGAVSVTSPTGCSWMATSSVSWITITSGSSGSGSGTVNYSVTPNTTINSRIATLTIAGQGFTVMQEGAVLPVISSLQPQQVVAGGPAFDLTLCGSNFMSGSVVRWNGQDRGTTFLGVTQLRAAILASDIAAGPSATVTVVNPGGGVSAPSYLSITPATNPSPTVTKLSPETVLKGSVGFKLTVVGTEFVPGSKVRWNGEPRGTSFERSTMLTAVIPATDVVNEPNAVVTVWNPSPGGGESTGVSLGILSGTVITDLSPSAVAPLAKGFTLTVYGQNFVAGTGTGSTSNERRNADAGPTVLWNGHPLTTVVVSSTELQADVPAALVGTGSATVAVTGGGSGSSNEVPVPIIPESRVPQLAGLNPKSVVSGSGQLALTVEGRDFVEGAKVLWNGEERTTQFVDSTKLQAVIPGTDIATPGASRVSVTNPAPGGGESNGQTFSYVQTLLYPRLVSSARSGSSSYDDSEYTGIAFTNLGTKEAAVTFTGFDKTGVPIAGNGITNPAIVRIGAGEQLPVVDYQVFGSTLPGMKPQGWFKMESSESGVVGFFLMFNESGSILDGTDVSSRTYTSYVVPEVEDGGFTQLHLVNPDVQPAEVLLELYGWNGTLLAPGVVRTLAPSAAVVEKVTNLFPTVTATGSDYVRVVSNRGIVSFEFLGKAGQYVEGLNGQDAEGGATVFYSPQYAVGGGDWWTALSIVNLEDRSGVVTLRLVGDSGAVLAGPITRTIAGRGKLRITDQEFFVPAGSTLTQGYVEVKSDGVRLAGSVVFGDPGRSRFASALPLVSRLQTDMVFSQLASDETYFTGLAILNPPSAGQVTAQIDVYDEKGIVIASKNENLAGGQRVSKLLIQYFPQLAGQKRSTGYIRVRTNQGVASFALFGTKDALSAVPAQDVR